MLSGKVAVVTGGTRGIGLEIVRAFLKNKAKVVLLGSRDSTVDKAIKELQEENKDYEVIGFYPKLNSQEEVKACFEKVINNFGKIDILVNNAGVSSSIPFDKMTDEEYLRVMDINLAAVYTCCRVVFDFMKKNGGVILNTSSMVSLYGQPSGVMYPASKAAINGLTKSLARELGKYNIRVNAIAPGITETDMMKNLDEKMIAPLIKNIPLGRVGKPEDVANAFLFLASDMASYISGAILSVDGAVVM